MKSKRFDMTTGKGRRSQARRDAIREERAARAVYIQERLEELRAERGEVYGDQRFDQISSEERISPRWIALGLAIAILLALSSLLFGCGAPSAEQLWLAEQVERCSAQKGHWSYDEKGSKTFECFRTPMLRMPKRIFKRNFNDDKRKSTNGHA